MKRSAEHISEPNEGNEAKKPAKLFSIFTQPPTTSGPGETNFRWVVPPMGPAKTCLHGVNLLPEPTARVAAFDLDGCLIQSSVGTKRAKGAGPTFQWWRPCVPGKLRQAYQAGFSIVIVTNQALRGVNALSEWKKKVPLIANALPDIPFHIFAATAKDGYRKPMPGIWYELQRIFSEKGIQIDKSTSFFVGDAAGRRGDHAATDRKWALNIRIPFLTPEEYFLDLKQADYTLPGFNVSSLPTGLPHVVPSDTPIVPDHPTSREIVIFVGYPALGKTTFYQKHFKPNGYIHVNQDILRTRDKCISAVTDAIKNSHSCVVDNTNRDVATRAHYIELARKFQVPIRCFLFNGSLELAWHNNLYRAYNYSEAPDDIKREVLPYTAFTSFKAKYEPPQPREGFSEIKQVNWTFEGDEEEHRRWSMWLQIDGK